MGFRRDGKNANTWRKRLEKYPDLLQRARLPDVVLQDDRSWAHFLQEGCFQGDRNTPLIDAMSFLSQEQQEALYCQGLVHDMRKTLFILIIDLFEGGNARELVQRMEELTASGVRAICLLALSDSGVPAHDENLARRFSEVGVSCFGCTPKMLPIHLEGALKGQDLFKLAGTCGTKVEKTG